LINYDVAFNQNKTINNSVSLKNSPIQNKFGIKNQLQTFRIAHPMKSLLLLTFLAFNFIACTYQLSCLNSAGSSVPWFYMIKYPLKTDEKTGETHRYVYFDSAMSSSNLKNFELRTNYVDIVGEALYETLNQANKNSDLEVIAWNDEPPFSTSYISSHNAHSKGVIVYDKATKTGLYIPHSTPKYPAIDSKGVINITVGTGQRIYGQNYLCMSLDQKNLEKIAEGLLLTGVTVYYNSLKDTSSSNLYNLGKGPLASISAENTKTIQFTLSSRLNIVGFFKNPYYESGFIFENVMVPFLQDSLLVESWGRPYQAPSCDIAGGYQTENIKTIQLCNDEEGSWTDVDDHSKWAITKTKKYVCSGDMNRMTSQDLRGGSFFCFEDTNFWSLLNGIIRSVDSCSAKSFLYFTN